jgi:hypothetical protein
VAACGQMEPGEISRITIHDQQTRESFIESLLLFNSFSAGTMLLPS